MHKHSLRLLGLVLIVMSLAVPQAHGSINGCSQCWSNCSADESACMDWCNGCPRDGFYSFWTTGGYVNCAGGVEQCMNNCHYEGLFCSGSCC